jgi:hypothetical protein
MMYEYRRLEMHAACAVASLLPVVLAHGVFAAIYRQGPRFDHIPREIM